MTFERRFAPVTKEQRYTCFYFMDKPISEAFQKLTFNLNGSIDVTDSYGNDFKLNIPTFGYTYQAELYEDTQIDAVAYRFPFKVGNKNYEIWLYFYFNVLKNKVKFSIKGNLPKTSKFNIPFSSSKTAFFKGSSIFFGKLNESTGVDFEHALGLDWSDINSVCQFNTGSKILSINLGTTINLDPYLVISPVSGSSAVDRPYQRKTFYAAGRHWVFFNDTYFINYLSSTDGSTWTGSNDVSTKSISSGQMFSVFFDGTYVHVAFCVANAGSAIYYRRGTPNSDGTITWSAAVQTVLPYYSDDANLDGVSAGSNIWLFGSSLMISPAIRLLDETATPGSEFWYTTVAATGSTPLNSIYVIKPYATTSSAVGATEPSSITNNGWIFGRPSGIKPLWCPDGYFVVTLLSKTGSTGTIWTGSVAARFWKSTGSQMTNAIAMSSWTTAIISGSSGTLNTAFGVAMYSGGATAVTGSGLAFDNEYLFLELYLKFTWTGSVSSSAQFAAQGSCSLTVPNPNNYYPTICADSTGTPWIAFTRRTAASNTNKYPYIIQCPASDGTWVFTSSKIHRWWSSNSDLGLTPEYQPCIIPLNSGRVLFNFVRHVTAGKVKSTLYSKHYTGSWDARLWSSSDFRSTSNAASEAYCITNIGDNALCCNLSGSEPSAGIEHNSWISGSGWTRSGSIITGGTVSTTSYPIMSASGSDYYCFWSSGANVYYKLYTAGAWGSSVTQETEGSAVDGTTLTGFFKDYSNINGLAYITGSGVTSILKYTFLGAAAVAAVYTFPMPIQIM